MKQSYSIEEQGTHNRDFVNLQIQILITRLFKSNLNTLGKLKNTSSLSEESSSEARKEILDAGNDTIREINNLINVFDFYISVDRLNAAKFPKKTVKKVVVSGVSEIR